MISREKKPNFQHGFESGKGHRKSDENVAIPWQKVSNIYLYILIYLYMFVYVCVRAEKAIEIEKEIERDEDVAIPGQQVFNIHVNREREVFNIHVNKRTQIYLCTCVYECVRKGPQKETKRDK